MRIESNYTSPGSGISNTSTTDSFSRKLKQQIQDIKKQIQELSADKNLTPDQKTEKQKELTEQLNDLTNQLNQHELEKKQEQQEKAIQKQKEQLERTNTGKKETEGSFKTETVQAMAAAETNQKIVQEKEGVRMELSHEAMHLVNAIKREELDGGVSSLRGDLNALYPKIGTLSEEAVSTLQGSASDLEKTVQEKITEEREEKSEEEKEHNSTVDHKTADPSVPVSDQIITG